MTVNCMQPVVALAMISVGVALCPAQSRFDNGHVSFKVPAGWQASTSERDNKSVRIQAAAPHAATIFVVFADDLPTEIPALKAALEERAVGVANSMLKQGIGFQVEKACPGAREATFAQWKAINCATLVRDAQGYRAMVGYFGIPLDGVTRLIVEFSSNYQGDLEELQKAQDMLENTLDFSKTHAGVQTPRSLRPTTVMQPGQESMTGWKLYHSAYFSFQYPEGWELAQMPNGDQVLVVDRSNRVRTLGIEFRPAFTNDAPSGSMTPCPSVDQVLLNEFDKLQRQYTKNNPSDPFDRVSVTYRRLGPGYLGGRSMDIDMVISKKWQVPISIEEWLNAVPRQNGLYLIKMTFPSEPMNVTESVRKPFAQSIVMAGKALPSTESCSY